MENSIRQEIELKIAGARATFTDIPDLRYAPKYLDIFLESFMEFEEEDPKLMKRFLVFQGKLNYVTTGTRGSHNKRLCGANKEDLAQNNAGKNKGYRIIFYTMVPGEVWFIAMFAKSDQKNLTKEQEELVCAVVEAIKSQAARKKKAT
jgi:hypothetical protein